MKKLVFIFSFLWLQINNLAAASKTISFNFYGTPFSFIYNDENFVGFDDANLSEAAIRAFYRTISQKDYSALLAALNHYRQAKQPDDWFYYQLVRNTAEQISPKSQNYLRYTLYKWYFMLRSGYTPLLSIHNNLLLFYIQSNENEYHFKIKVNPKIKTLFANYPTVDYENYLNIPLSSDTYSSLIPALKKFLKGKTEKQGLDYLMQLTRYAFVFEPDTKQFGQEKRLTPEQTLLYENSDCEDRVIFFFSLVKEIYNLPMIVITYPQHVTIAVNFDKRGGTPIMYEGKPYYICEPTPQTEDLNIGQQSSKLKKENFEVVYSYLPK
ncbi:MAG: hypothetical protein QM640_11685 [Niabella sp.]